MLSSFHTVSHSEELANVRVSEPVMFVNSNSKHKFHVKREQDLTLGSLSAPHETLHHLRLLLCLAPRLYGA